MSSLNKSCAAFVLTFVALVGSIPYIVDAAFGTHVVQSLNKVK